MTRTAKTRWMLSTAASGGEAVAVRSIGMLCSGVVVD